MNNERIDSEIKLSNNSSFVILIFVILKFRNIGRSTFRRSKFRSPPSFSIIRVRVKISNSQILEWLTFRIRKLTNIPM